MIKDALDVRKRVELKIGSLKNELLDLEAKRDELQHKYEQVVRQEKSRVVKGDPSGSGGKLAVLAGLAKTRVNELRNTLSGVVKQRDDLRVKVDELETILRKFKDEYNPNFNDEGVKAAVKAFEDYAAHEVDVHDLLSDSEIGEVLMEDSETNGVNWKEFEDPQAEDTDICKLTSPHLTLIYLLIQYAVYDLEAYLPSFLRSAIHDKLNLLRIWLIESGVLADTHQPGTESTLVKAAREAAEAADKDVKKKTKDLKKEQEDLDKDYGPSDVFRAMQDKCVTTDSGEYTYELCWLGKTSQNSKKGHGHTSMGTFARIDREMADDEDRLDGRSLGKGERMVLRYEDGQSCWNGPRRRTDVWLGCAETEELWRISESEKCVYRMEVGTPAACEGHEAEYPTVGKDEL